MQSQATRIDERPDLRDRPLVFSDREQAGEILSGMLRGQVPPDALVLAIPAGGVPVGVALARALDLQVEAVPVSKMTPPFNSEVGYGAVAFDGTEQVNPEMIARLQLTERDVEKGACETHQKVKQRWERFRAGRPEPELSGRQVLLVDDGLASGITMLTAVEALRKKNPAGIRVCVPTAHPGALARLLDRVEGITCANLRTRSPFAVADAYRNWRDLDEEEAVSMLNRSA